MSAICEYPDCEKVITAKMAWVSLNLFKKELCLEHQREERIKTLPPKLAKFLNEKMDETYGSK